MSFAVGHNVPGYLPDSTVSIVETFDGAVEVLVWDLMFQEDYAEDEDTAESFCHAAGEVNLWLTPQNTDVIAGEVWWIMESDEEVDGAS